MKHRYENYRQLFNFGRVLMIVLFVLALVGWTWAGFALNPLGVVNATMMVQPPHIMGDSDSIIVFELDGQDLSSPSLTQEQMAEFFEQESSLPNSTEGWRESDLPSSLTLNFLLAFQLAASFAAIVLPLVFERFFASKSPGRLFGHSSSKWLRIAAALLALIAISQIVTVAIPLTVDPLFGDEFLISAFAAHLIYEASEAVPILVVSFGLEVIARLISSAADMETETELTV